MTTKITRPTSSSIEDPNNERTKIIFDFIGKNIAQISSAVILFALIGIFCVLLYNDKVERNWPFIGPLISLFAGVLVGKKV